MSNWEEKRREAFFFRYLDYKKAKEEGREYVPKIDLFVKLPGPEIEYSRSCADVARQLYKIREYKKTETYALACKLQGFAEYTSLVEYNIARSAKCDGKCPYCLNANEAGF